MRVVWFLLAASAYLVLWLTSDGFDPRGLDDGYRWLLLGNGGVLLFAACKFITSFAPHCTTNTSLPLPQEDL